MIFSHVLYQLSYLGFAIPGRTAAEATRSLAFAPITVHPVGRGLGAGNSIAFAEPLQKVAILAPARAEGRMVF